MNNSPENLPGNHPGDLQDPERVRFGLSRAIQLHSEEYRLTSPQIKLDLDLVEDENLLPKNTCLALYQVYLERLQQIAGDTQARRVWIHYYPSRTQMILDIKDDGKGDSTSADFARMRDCVEEAGGQLLVTAQPGQGTTITAKAPFGS